MTSESLWVRQFCRLHALLLLAYPRDFRLEYGRDMQQLFRDQCRDAARNRARARFLLHSMADWLAASFRERLATFSLAQALRAIWTAGRRPMPRGFATEWAVTIILYLF